MKWISILLIALAMDCTAQSIHIGTTGLLPNTDSGNGGLILAQQTTLSEAATLQSFSFYIVSSAGTVQLAGQLEWSLVILRHTVVEALPNSSADSYPRSDSNRNSKTHPDRNSRDDHHWCHANFNGVGLGER